MTKAPENKPVFPNAVIHVPASEYSFWMDPAVIEKLPEARRPLAKRIQEMFPLMKVRVSQFSGDKEVVPGIRPIEAQGHTPGHVAYHVSSGKDQLLLVGDSINIPALFVMRDVVDSSDLRLGGAVESLHNPVVCKNSVRSLSGILTY